MSGLKMASGSLRRFARYRYDWDRLCVLGSRMTHEGRSPKVGPAARAATEAEYRAVLARIRTEQARFHPTGSHG